MPDLSNSTIGLIGIGNMGEATLKTLLTTKTQSTRILLASRSVSKLSEIAEKYSCKALSAEEVISEAAIVFVAVKPQDLDRLLEVYGHLFTYKHTIVSMVAGKTTKAVEKFLAPGVRVLRMMPNTPISVGEGASAISKGKYAKVEDVKAVQELLKASGRTIVVDESLQDAVTATSGSGPAYFFRFVEAMIAGAQELGLSEADARTLVIQTITGAAAMLNQEGADPGVLRQNVTSPNGTTYAALQVFEGGDIEGLVKRAMKAARDRSQELS